MGNLTLFSTFISPGEVLDWENFEGTFASAMVDEAYGRWLDEDKERAEFYHDCWKGFVHVRPTGGYSVWIEADPATAPTHSVEIPRSTVRRCRELTTELRGIGNRIGSLSVDEMALLVGLDGRVSDILEELADEFIDLLVDNNLAAPLVKEVYGE